MIGRESDSLLDRFAKSHAIDIGGLLETEREGIRCLLRCTDMLDADYVALPESVHVSDQIVGVMRHLLARCAEHVESAITACATASGAAPEVMARVAIESAVTIGFILLEPRSRLAAYFRYHVDEVDRQVSKWRSSIASLPPGARQLHRVACDRRGLANTNMRAFVDRLENDLLGSEPRVKWPSKIIHRFEALHDEITYRTIYARLCSDTHFDAEETLLYGMSNIQGPEAFERTAVEIVCFARLMVATSVCYYLKVVGAYATVYKMANTIHECEDCLATMEQVSAQLSEFVGAGPISG